MMQKIFKKIRELLYQARTFWLICVILNIITFFLVFYKIHPGGETLALHYNILVGVELFGKGFNLYLIPAAAVILTAINFILYRYLRLNKNFYAASAIFASVAVQLIMLLSVILLTQVN